MTIKGSVAPNHAGQSVDLQYSYSGAWHTVKTATLTSISKSLPAPCDPATMAALEAAAERHAPGLWQRMPSGAGRDAQYIAKRMPVSMLFVPSIGGISHHWTENTSDEDIVLGAQVFCDALARILMS